MLLKKFFIYPHIVEGLEVSKIEFEELASEFDYIKTTELDPANLGGVIFGDIQNILHDRGMETFEALSTNPRCWFTNKGFKSLDREDFSFGEATEFLKQGYEISRKDWGGFMSIFMMPGSKINIDYQVGDVFCKKVSANKIHFGWLPSQTDILSHDWYIIK